MRRTRLKRLIFPLRGEIRLAPDGGLVRMEWIPFLEHQAFYAWRGVNHNRLHNILTPF